MMRHPLVAILLALVLAAGSVLSGAAMAREGGRVVELCSDAGAVAVTLDAQGNPTLAHRPCPLCLAANDMAAAPAPATWSRPEAAAAVVASHAPAPAFVRLHRTAAPARAPPLSV